VISRRDDDSPGYSDIFRGNAANCGLLLIELNPTDHAKLVAAASGAEITVSLPDQTVLINGESLSFEINEATKLALIAGLDLIGTTLQYNSQIADYEATKLAYAPPLEVA
jgi:3-isopropylmalate/(R)-2-methylmalate dehydratase small subunit